MKTKDKPIIVEQFFTISAERLWRAITEPEEMRLWFFENMPNFKAKPGFETQFPVQSEERTFTHLWKVTEVIPFKKLTVNWKYKEYKGDSFVSFQISGEKKSLKLTVSTVIRKDFPDEIPEFTRDSCINGWNYFIGERLKEYINKNGN